MLLSLSGVHVFISSGKDCVSHMAMPNQSDPATSFVNDAPGGIAQPLSTTCHPWALCIELHSLCLSP